MKLYKFLLLCFTIVLSTTLAKAQSAAREPSISVEISIPKSTIRVGSAIMLTAAMKNVSTHDIHYVITTAAPLFEITVTTRSGKLAPETDLGRRRHTWLPQHGSNVTAIFSTPRGLSPQKSIEAVEDVSKEFEITLPGRYSVWVEVQDPEHRAEKVKSNVIDFTVVSQ